MNFQIKLTKLALQQIQDILSYISNIINEPALAKRFLVTLKHEMSSLSSMPMRLPKVDFEPWFSLEIRKMKVKNFIVYFKIDKEKETVYILAVVYGKREQETFLKNISNELD